MHIIVCIKQVPKTTKVDIDKETGVLKREGIEAKINPYDLYAIETALRIREQHGGCVTALTMGPFQAQEILKEAYSMGVDECILLSDRAFAGADVLATSYALSQAIKVLGDFDLIICGKQTTDGDTAQVGAEIAEFLDVPHGTNVSRIINIEQNMARIEMDMIDSFLIQDIYFPCLIAVEKDIHTPRLPSYKKRISTKEKEIQTITLNDLGDKNPRHYGLNGSPTQVEKIYVPDVTSVRTAVEGDSDKQANFIYEKLKALKFI